MCEFFRHVGAFLERAFKATSVRDGFCMAGVYPYSARQIMSTCRDGSWCQLDKTAFPGYELSEAEQKVLTAVDMAARKRLREGRGLPLDAELCEAAGLPLPRGDDSSLYLHRAALLNRSGARADEAKHADQGGENGGEEASRREEGCGEAQEGRKRPGGKGAGLERLLLLSGHVRHPRFPHPGRSRPGAVAKLRSVCSGAVVLSRLRPTGAPLTRGQTRTTPQKAQMNALLT